MSANQTFRLLSFNTVDAANADGSSYSQKEFTIQMFGVNETGQTASIFVKGYNPFFYIKVGDDWTESEKSQFMAQIEEEVGEQITAAIHSTKLIKRKKLYGFDGGKTYNFIQFNFLNEVAMKKVKGLWYSSVGPSAEYRLKPDGYMFEETSTILYEAQIPPLIRFFHIKEISPSGWIELPHNKIKTLTKKTTSCTFEYSIQLQDIISLPLKETRVPYKICSFDIEASSSHGDFPLPVKNYKKLATNIVDICKQQNTYTVDLLQQIILTAFGYGDTVVVDNVDKVYPIDAVANKAQIEKTFVTWIKIKPATYKTDDAVAEMMELGMSVSDVLGSSKNNGNSSSKGDDGSDSESDGDAEEDDEHDEGTAAASDVEKVFNWRSLKAKPKTYKKRGTILDLLTDEDETRETKLLELTRTLTATFPQLEGDNVTFIGSTFLRYGDEKPYLNHCIARDTCNQIPNAVIESYKTEKEVLLAWTELIQKEDPDIIIGYNIFGFDYQFMYLRAKELKCERSFLRLSRNKNEICLKRDWRTGREGLEENTLVIASGQHDLKYAKMTGRLQIDMYNYLRRDYQLTQYKLDYVSGYFIGDGVKKLEYITPPNTNSCYTKVYSKNLTGLEPGSFINFEEEAHSVDSYKNGQKFEVSEVDYANGTFTIQGKETPDLITKKVRWGLAKDDVTPQDIFRMTNEGPAERAVIAKYCIQDCNLVHHLMRKIDVMTDYSEMASLCSVPMDFLVMRGQSIKLTSYIAKKCREKGTLMPVIEKSMDDEGYEGATVLDPKCNLYLDDPVACVDYAALYPSSMMSENISHDSKVWTREYDLTGKLLKETGDKETSEAGTGTSEAGTGKYKYDNLPGYEYVDITYNTYKWQRKNGNPKAGMEKIKVGSKVCRFAQYPVDKATGKPGRAVMPAILEELLAARKATRKLIPEQKDEFMKNVLDKRQLSIKVTANSLYGQTGAKTSSFYEKDCAASTTAIGRKLLTYAKRVIEEAYANTTVPTKNHGMVQTNAEYVYGDTDSVFFKFNLKELDGTPIKGQKALELTIELAQQAGKLASKFLKNPHDLEYEKTFLPFCLLSKKRYVGMLYEHDLTKCKRKSMGIVLKRRDNAPIVKDIYGGVIDILMKEKNVEMAANFLKECLKNMVEENYGMEKLIITKSLRSGYKNPNQIAHKVLADRIGRRDPGNKPSVGDRIAFVYIENPSKKALQGERIETPEYIVQNKIKINYSFYITNQIMKPLQQVFALVLEQLKDFKKAKGHTLRTWKNALESLRKEYPDDEKYRDKEDSLRNKEVKALLFDPYLRETNNMKNGNSSITQFFAPVKK
jgi:DNA polymerase elongation subunit (family B)